MVRSLDMILSSVRMRKIFLNTPAIALVLLGGTVAGAVIGCSAMSIEEEKTAQAATPQAAPPQAQAQRKPQPLASVKEATLQDQPFNIQQLSVGEVRGQTTLRVKFSAPVTQYRHFTLTMPSRVVLDIYGETKRVAQAETFSVSTDWVGTLRLSSSEGYLRLVMDITAASVPAYVVEPENGGLKIVIGPVNPQSMAKKDVQLIRAGKRGDVQVAEAKPGGAASEAQVSAAQTGLTGEKKYTGQRISLDFKDQDIKNVFRLLAEVSGLNIVVTDYVARKVTIRLVYIPWDQALDLLIQTNGLDKESMGNVVRISTAARLKTESDQRAQAIKAKENEEVPQTAYMSVNYAKVKDLVDKIKPVLSARGQVVADDRSNTIIVRDIKKYVDEANTLVSRLDTRTAQVLIESNLIETTPTFARALGLRLDFDYGNRGAVIEDDGSITASGRMARFFSDLAAGAPASGSPFFSIVQSRLGPLRTVGMFLSAAEQEGNIKIISRPSVVTLNNVASTIQSLRILRVILPSSTNIASGSGAAAGSAVATGGIK